jgi:signal transduction histidine kinase
MDIKDIILFIVSIVTAYLSLFIVRGKNASINKSFAMYILFVGLWALGLALFDLSNNVTYSIYFAKFYYISAAAIPMFFLYFSLSFPKNNKVSKLKHFGIISSFLALVCLIVFTKGFILTDVYLTSPKTVKINDLGYLIYAIYFIIIILLSYIKLFRTYLEYRGKNQQEESQLKLLMIGTLVPYLFGMWFDLILPYYDYSYIWAGPPFGLAVVLVILYSIFKYKLFNIKVITTELLAAALWLFILSRFLLSQTFEEKVMDGTLLFLTLVVGIFLIKSVRKEVEVREKIQKIAIELEDANERLKILDQQKTEFISLASHQLRGPLTAIKGYASMVLEGDFGPTTDPIKETVSKILKSTSDLVVLVGDFLDVSRIEQGRMQYNFEHFDIAEEVETVITELKPTIEKAHLTVSYDIDKNQNYSVDGDRGKLKQVIGNLIDNSIKYTPQGSVHVWVTRKENNKILITISDTGVGIKKEVLPNLFEKFSRAPDASKTNILGTGLGLYIAKKMVEAHRGRIWAESAGENKGASFFIELEGSN